jgi:hypothetical protein
LEIADWLRGLSLERYAETFRDNAIDVAVLPELSEADLEKLECKSGGQAQVGASGVIFAICSLGESPAPLEDTWRNRKYHAY